MKKDSVIKIVNVVSNPFFVKYITETCSCYLIFLPVSIKLVQKYCYNSELVFVRLQCDLKRLRQFFLFVR